MQGDPQLLAQLDDAAREKIQWLLDRETEYLDQGRYPEWLALYAADCTYWVPAVPGQVDAVDHVSLFFEDRALMEMRIARLTGGDAHSLELPLRVSHVTGPALLAGIDSETGEVQVTRRFQATEYQDRRTRDFAGLFTYYVTPVNDAWRIRTKRVDLVDCDGPFEPLQVFI
ncbi:MAG: nuclear transport factor 2 family protein [Chromatiales bacterium]|nr:MAG: nuclear transport factor 2 family protein [Chromatiales bacterium]